MKSMNFRKVSKLLFALIMLVAIFSTSLSSIAFAESETNTGIITIDKSSIIEYDSSVQTAGTMQWSKTFRIPLPPAESGTSEKTSNSSASIQSTPSWFDITIGASSFSSDVIVIAQLYNVITPATSFSGNLNVYNYLGSGTSTNYLYASLFYSHQWTYTIPMTATVEEDVRLVSGSLVKDFQTYVIPTLEVPRYKQLGGSYGSITNAMNGHRHHCFSDWVYGQTTVNKYDSNRNVVGTVSATYAAPVVLMTPEDHQLSASYGSGASAVAYRNSQLALVRQGKYLEAMQMDINDIHSKFGDRYNGAIEQMWSYAIFGLGWYQ